MGLRSHLSALKHPRRPSAPLPSPLQLAPTPLRSSTQASHIPTSPHPEQRLETPQLGRFDCRLIEEDARFSALNQEQSSSSHESTRLADRLTLSYFWMLAAYELVRTLDQRWRTGATTLPDESGNRVTALKRRMERLRSPLAKTETARRFPIDHAMAYPTISRDFGLAWHVAQDTYISRRELSDQLLDFLADLKKRQTQKKT